MKPGTKNFRLIRNTGRMLCALALPALLFACGDGSQAPLTPRAQYSAEDPGEWSAQAAAHAPLVELRGANLHVRVPLRGAGPEHYIEKIGILDETGRDAVAPQLLGRDLRASANIEALLPRPERSGNYRVYARCNLHDLWIAELKIP